MPSDPQQVYIVGNDGKTPIYNPEGSFHIWSMFELWLGPGHPGLRRYVPKLKDLVLDTDLMIWYRVVGHDVNMVAQLQRINEVVSHDIIDPILGVHPGGDSETYRIYIDKRVTPYAVTVDQRCWIPGSASTYAKVFRGVDLTDDGEIISHMYDPGGQILGNSIPLEPCNIPPEYGENLSIKSVPTFYTMADLPDREQVTLVCYRADGGVSYRRSLMVENSAFMAGANAEVKYITGISLECPFLSEADPRLIQLPINVLLQGVNMMGVVHYSDGSVSKMPVDGTKFALLGLENYIATQVDQEAHLVLRYRVSPNEIIYNAGQGEFTHKSEVYRIKTMQADGAYSVKLFGYPVWLNAVDGYTLRWYMYNADRGAVYDVTGMVEFSANNPAFNPTQYGIMQNLVVAVNLKNVNPVYRNYRHVQTIGIVLWGPGTNRTTNWTIAFDPGQIPPYGENNYAGLLMVNSNLYKLNVSMGAASKEEWLDRLYYRSKPILDQAREQTLPVPTHFRIKIGTNKVDFPVDQWNFDNSIGAGLSIDGTVFLEFIRRTPDTDLQLSVAAMPIYPLS